MAPPGRSCRGSRSRRKSAARRGGPHQPGCTPGLRLTPGPPPQPAGALYPPRGPPAPPLHAAARCLARQSLPPPSYKVFSRPPSLLPVGPRCPQCLPKLDSLSGCPKARFQGLLARPSTGPQLSPALAALLETACGHKTLGRTLVPLPHPGPSPRLPGSAQPTSTSFSFEQEQGGSWEGAETFCHQRIAPAKNNPGKTS
ncbi:hypothetical protein AAY473_023801 [Plecturocebus cupreus]